MRNFKYLSVIWLMLVGNYGFAQSASNPGTSTGNHSQVEEISMLSQLLHLDSSQVNKVKDILSDFNAKIVSLNNGQRNLSDRKLIIKDYQLRRLDQLKLVLTPKQYALYVDQIEKIKRKSRERRG